MDALESVTTHVTSLVTQLGGRKRAVQDCAWLDSKLDELIEIADNTAKKSEIVELAAIITAAEIETCTAEELQNLIDDVELLESIICDLKQQMGQSCGTSSVSHTTVVSHTTRVSHTTGVFPTTGVSITTRMSHTTRESHTTRVALTTKGSTTRNELHRVLSSGYDSRKKGYSCPDAVKVPHLGGVQQ